MDEVKTRSDLLYEIKDIMKDHNLTAEQALYLLCEIENIEYDISARDLVSLYNKNLIVKGKVNQTLLFHLKKPKQLALDLKTHTKPIGTEYSLKVAEVIEKTFVPDMYLTEEERKRIADEFFKGDMEVARYFIIFKSLFPVRDKKRNAKWNKKFGFQYDGISLWDESPRVAKKFHEIYRKKDIGVFLEATYQKVKDSTKFEDEVCFMTKPYKFLTAYGDYYEQAKTNMEERQKRSEKSGNSGLEKQNKLNV